MLIGNNIYKKRENKELSLFKSVSLFLTFKLFAGKETEE